MSSGMRAQALARLALVVLVSGVVSCGEEPTTVGERRPRASDQLRAVSGDSQVQVATRALRWPLEVRVMSTDGNAIRGDTVVFATVSEGSFAEGGRVVSDEDGRASAVWILGPKAGEQYARVTLASRAGIAVSALTFQATALPDNPALLELLVPDSADVPPAPLIRFPLSALVLDAHGNGVPGVVVRWEHPTLGTVEADATLSGADGGASTHWTVASPAGDSVSVAEYSLTVRIDDARARDASPRTIHRRIGVTAHAAMAGVWIADRWEFFEDSARTRLIEDVMANGMSGTLVVNGTESGVFDWFWYERYRWWGPSKGTDIWGQFSLNGPTITATVIGGYSELECDWGDCDGPLHGLHDAAFVDSRLVVTRRQRVGYYRAFGPSFAWSRLTLSRR